MDRYIQTATLAKQIDYKPASIRTAYWRHGHFGGVVPLKTVSGRLLWPADAAQRIAAAGSAGEGGAA